METTIALQNLERIVKERKVRKNSLAYISALEAITYPGREVVCGKHTGTGRFAKSTSWQYQTCMLLQLVGVEFKSFNVAPRGGKAGHRVQVEVKHLIKITGDQQILCALTTAVCLASNKSESAEEHEDCVKIFFNSQLDAEEAYNSTAALLPRCVPDAEGHTLTYRGGCVTVTTE